VKVAAVDGTNYSKKITTGTTTISRMCRRHHQNRQRLKKKKNSYNKNKEVLYIYCFSRRRWRRWKRRRWVAVTLLKKSEKTAKRTGTNYNNRNFFLVFIK
jgi:hypothetical protein